MRLRNELQLNDFLRPDGSWLRGVGPESDIVISSRIRLARNVSGLPFQLRMSDDQRRELVQQVSEAIPGHAIRVDLNDASPIDRSLLVERHLISKELANGDGPRSAFFGPHEVVSIMANEEDHLRIQCIHSGFDLRRLWRALVKLDVSLSRQMPFVFNQRLGYLTACPTNTGTAMRVSVMLHLPALTMKDHIDKVKRSVDMMNLTIRGLYGEGTRASGDFYQISNQATLGRSEEEIIRTIETLIPIVLRYERGMRKALLADERSLVDDRVERALATLRAARRLDVDEMMQHLSMVRFALLEGLIPAESMTIDELNRLFILCQPAHLQKQAGRSLSADERDELRAEMLRTRFSADSVN